MANHKIASRLRDARAERGRVSDIFLFARVRILPEGFCLIGNRNFLWDKKEKHPAAG